MQVYLLANMFLCFKALLPFFVAVLILRPDIVKAQQLKTVIAGEAVEFTCTLTESLPAGDVSWRIQWDGSSTPVFIDAEATSPVSGPEFSSSHGEFRTIYVSKRLFTFKHECTLIIENVQLADAGQYSCKHIGNFRDRGIFAEHELRVLPRPPDDALPRCSHSVILSSANSPQDDTIELSCQFSGGNPPARLIWYKQGLQLGDITENSNVMEYQLQASDNGLEFSCHAMSTALAETSYCHLTPLEIQPLATLTPSKVEATNGADVTFTCSGEGIPSIHRMDWYIDGVLQQGESARGVIHTNLATSNKSHLTLHDLQDSDDGMDVMCEVSIPSGLTADSLARISMISHVPTDIRVYTTTTDRSTQMRVTDQGIRTLTSKEKTNVVDTKITSKMPKVKSTSGSNRGNDKVTTHSYKRIEIGPGTKLGNSQHDPSQKSKKSNTPVTATAIGLVCLLIIVVVIVVVVKRRRSRPHKDMEIIPPSPTDSLPVARSPTGNEYTNNMYEGTIYNTSQGKATENFYQTTPFDEDPEKTWSTHEGCGIWQDSKVHTYENTAIGSPFPTFARQNHNGRGESESEHFLYDVVERQGDNTI